VLIRNATTTRNRTWAWWLALRRPFVSGNYPLHNRWIRGKARDLENFVFVQRFTLEQRIRQLLQRTPMRP
jgi:hypothetical protein